MNEKLSYKISKYIPVKSIKNNIIEIIDFIENPNISKDNKEINKIVNKLVWHIPFRNLRNSIRELLLHILEIKKRYSRQYFINYLDFKEIYNRLICGLSDDDVKLVDNLLYKSLHNKTYLNEEEFDKLKKIENEHNLKIKKLMAMIIFMIINIH